MAETYNFDQDVRDRVNLEIGELAAKHGMTIEQAIAIAIVELNKSSKEAKDHG